VNAEDQFQSSPDQEVLSSFDIEKFKQIFLKSWIFLVAFLAITCTSAYIYLRYTPPTYESSSVIKLDFGSEASMLNISSPVGQGGSVISGEIELLKSRLFFGKVVEAINMDVSYYKYGRILDGERFQNSPFEVSYGLKRSVGPIDIDILDDTRFTLSYGDHTEEYKYDEEIDRPEFNLIITKTRFFNESAFGRYYFVINSKKSQVDYLVKRVRVVPESFNAKTLRISIQAKNQLKAQMLIQTIDSIYEIYTREAKNQAFEQKISFLDERIEATDSVLSWYEKYFENFIIKNRTIDLRDDLGRTIVGLEELDTSLIRPQLLPQIRTIDLKLLKIQIERNEPLIINDLFIESLPQVVSNLLREYQSSLQDLESKRSSYNENSLIVQQFNDKAAQLKTRLTNIIDAYIDQIQAQLNFVNSREKDLQSSLNQLPALETEYIKNRRFYNQQQQFMLTLRQAKMDIEITIAGTVTDITILSPASYPSVSIKPQKTLIYGLGAISGLMIGLLFLLVRYVINNKITGLVELERLTNVPILGSVPFYKQEKLSTTKLVIGKDSKSSLSESLRTIRTNMEFMNGTNSKHVISVTSTISGEGKTFLGVNLGGIIALSGQRVCVVDIDMRKPKIHLAFGNQESAKGVSTILSGRSTLSDSLQSTSIENFSYLPAGPVPPNPSELLIGELFDRLLKDLQKDFDVVILDTPPVGLVTDGILVMKKADLQLYVVRSGYSRRDYIKTLENLKKTGQFNNLTIVFNSLKSSSAYGYGYGYGYGYYDEGSKK